MSEHIERVKAEHKELDVKIKALDAFIHFSPMFRTLDALEQVRMIKQLGFMEAYAAVLNSRIWAAV